MATKPLPSPEVLRQLLRYEPDTGRLFWLPRPCEFFATSRACNSWNGQFPGTEAMTTITARGHKQGIVLRRQFLAHRVAWAIYYGEWPSMDIDHINVVPSDNRIVNLRLATPSENARNKFRYSNNTSGLKGASWFPPNGKWAAKIRLDRKLHHLGYFETAEEAHAAYCEAAEKMHGEFARLS